MGYQRYNGRLAPVEEPRHPHYSGCTKSATPVLARLIFISKRSVYSVLSGIYYICPYMGDRNFDHSVRKIEGRLLLILMSTRSSYFRPGLFFRPEDRGLVP